MRLGDAVNLGERRADRDCERERAGVVKRQRLCESGQLGLDVAFPVPLGVGQRVVELDALGISVRNR